MLMHKPTCTKVGVVTTAQVMYSLGEDRFANIKLLMSEELPVKDWMRGICEQLFCIEVQTTSATYYKGLLHNS